MPLLKGTPTPPDEDDGYDLSPLQEQIWAILEEALIGDETNEKIMALIAEAEHDNNIAAAEERDRGDR